MIIQFIRTLFGYDTNTPPPQISSEVGYFHYHKYNNCVCKHDCGSEKNVSYPICQDMDLNYLQHNETVYGSIINNVFHKELSEWQ
jgi:hypothetical protein